MVGSPQIVPVSFEPVARADREVGFEIAFNSEDEAHLFEREFVGRFRACTGKRFAERQ